MRVICSKCGGPHPVWDCHASAAQVANYAAQRKVEASITVPAKVDGLPRAAKAIPAKLPAGVVTADKLEPTPKPEKKGKRGRPATGFDRKAYQRDAAKKRRAAKKAAPK